VIKEIAAAIHVRQIHTPMGMAERFTRSSQVNDVATHMDRYQHDVTPVFPDEPASGPHGRSDPDGTPWRSDLEGMDPQSSIHAVARPLSSAVLIDSRANLLELLDRFRASHTFLLVVGSGGRDGIVTPSDMNKQAGRTHLFMHVSALELALAARLRASDPSEGEVRRLLPLERAGTVRGRLRRNLESDQATDLVAMLDFQDLLLLEGQLGTSVLRSTLNPQRIKGLSEFRNRVMHAVLQPAGDSPERLDDLLSRTELVQGILEAIGDRPA
jgi:hypothetical protein